jgi:hypothetical protein
MSRVTVFLTDADELAAYKPVLTDFGVNIEVGHGVGLDKARNKIVRWYPPGTDLIQMDDDLLRIVHRADAKTLVDVIDLPRLFNAAFDAAFGTLWGLYPVANAFYMSAKLRQTGLWFVDGSLFGHTLLHTPEEFVSVDHGEDYERSIRFFLARGAITRFEDYSFKARFYSEPGGMQDTRTPANVASGVQYVIDTWPHLARLHVSADGRPNIRFKAVK